MGTMNLNLFKKIIDEIEGKVQFVTLASRGEPLVSKQINEMLKYTSGKFLNLKINTNASLLNEEKNTLNIIKQCKNNGFFCRCGRL